VVPEISCAEPVVYSTLLLSLALCTNKPLEIPLQMLSQHLDVRVYFGHPTSIYVVYIRNMNFLATETSNGLCAVVLGLGSGRD
jgi:hypothetical protein